MNKKQLVLAQKENQFIFNMLGNIDFKSNIINEPGKTTIQTINGDIVVLYHKDGRVTDVIF